MQTCLLVDSAFHIQCMHSSPSHVKYVFHDRCAQVLVLAKVLPSPSFAVYKSCYLTSWPSSQVMVRLALQKGQHTGLPCSAILPGIFAERSRMS